MMRILAAILSILLIAAPVLAQETAAPQNSEQQEESFSRDMQRMFIRMMERMLIEMKRNMLGEEHATPCDCNCAAPGEEV